MRGKITLLTAMAAVLVGAAPAEAKKKAPPPAPVAAPQVAVPNSPNGTAVRYFYERRNYTPVWFKPGAGDEAIGLLLSVLRRAPIDGMANGPQVAASVEAAVAAARAGDPLKHKEAELALSAAWVDYVSALQRPNNNVIWGDPSLVLKPSHPERILALLSAAPSVASHLQSVSSVNTIYAKLREVAVTEAAANGGQASDVVLLNMERARILPALPLAFTCAALIGVPVSTQVKFDPRPVLVPSFRCFSCSVVRLPVLTSKHHPSCAAGSRTISTQACLAFFVESMKEETSGTCAPLAMGSGEATVRAHSQAITVALVSAGRVAFG